MAVARIAHVHGATPDVMADVLLRGKNSHPKPMDHEDLKPVRGNGPKFIAMNAKMAEKGFETKERKHHKKAHQLVLMDGSLTCFLAKINTGLAECTGHD